MGVTSLNTAPDEQQTPHDKTEVQAATGLKDLYLFRPTRAAAAPWPL